MTNKKTRKGGNGTVIIDESNKTAIKRLRNTSKESKTRYKKEMEALEYLRGMHISNIVEVLEINIDKEEIVMRAYDGDLGDVFYYTKGNPENCIKLLLPIVEALKQLSELDNPIYHRDLKPENLLYANKEGQIELFLSDFGCCYFEQESDRQTPQFRAVGARSYRAPEYDYGRVENVTEKCDIYSIGKILWSMINGEKREVFPYTLWFPDEYNLMKRLPVTSELIIANIIIAKCVSVIPEDRPTYDELISLMCSIMEKKSFDDMEKKLRIEMLAAKQRIQLEEDKSINESLLRLVYEDFDEVLHEWAQEYEALPLCHYMVESFEKASLQKERSIAAILEQNTIFSLFHTSFYNLDVILLSRSAHSTIKQIDTGKHIAVEVKYEIKSSGKKQSLLIFNKAGNVFLHNGEYEATYSKNELRKFLEDMIDDYAETI